MAIYNSQTRERVSRQTIALCRKNLLLFYRSPFSTVFRALVLPIFFTVILSSVNKFTGIGSISREDGGFASASQPIKTLWEAMEGVPLKKLVLCRNGFSGPEVDDIFNSTAKDLSLDRYIVIDDADDLIYRCRQSLSGISDCVAAVILISVNATNVEYIIAVDSSHTLFTTDYKTHSAMTIDRIMPIQWAVDSSIGNFKGTPQPSELPWSGSFGKEPESSEFSSTDVRPWFMIIYYFVAPVFLLSLIGVVYHLSLFVANERESGITNLLAAQTCSKTPRIISTILSFVAIYSPGWLICSILMSQLLFTRCPDMILFFLTLLAGISITTWALFLASFFQKAQLAGIYASIITFALAFGTVAFVFEGVPNFTGIQVLGALFPPFTFAALIGDIARAEDSLTAFSLSKSSLPKLDLDPFTIRRVVSWMDGYLYVVFFLLQIFVYIGATFAVEHYKWGVNTAFEDLESSTGIAVKCTELSKTFKARRRWYWPCSTIGRGHHAVKNMNLELKRGSVNFLLGPNGGGKTTTLKLISGMLSSDSGSRIQINQDSRRFGCCPQQNVGLVQNFMYSQRLMVIGILGTIDHVRIWRQIKAAPLNTQGEEDDVLVECDILEKADQAVETLSGGQQRKVQLAISFVGSSNLCFIDEASSGLDPLSRRNIWKIISNSSRRTILITTHFLDEADMLADNIAIIYEGKLITTGTSTSLKARYGKGYEVCQLPEDDEIHAGQLVPPICHTKTSIEATQKLLELEELSGGLYSVTFPSLDQAFLHLTSSSLNSEVNANDSVAGTEIARQETERQGLNMDGSDDSDLEIGRRVGFFAQLLALLKKRYLLARHNWLSTSLALAIPTILAVALSSTFSKFSKFSQCLDNLDILTQNASILDADSFSQYEGEYTVLNPLFAPEYVNDLGSYPVSAVVGPPSAFEGNEQTRVYVSNMEQYFPEIRLAPYLTAADRALGTRGNVSTLDEMIALVEANHGEPGFGIFTPSPNENTIIHRMSPEYTVAGLNIISNRLALSSTSGKAPRTIHTTYRKFRHVEPTPDSMSIPLLVFITLGFICSTSVSIMYPVSEKVNNVRALQYSNSVSPGALWSAYLLFDMHTGFLISFVTWGALFAANSSVWYESTFVLFALILFCIATYLGLYICSMFLKKAAFAVAVCVHIMLMVVYLLAYIVNQSKGPVNEYHITLQIQGALGLTSPAANLLRTFFIASNNFGITCGETGWYNLHPIAFTLYGGVYINLILQIMFLVLVITCIEYHNMDWVFKLIPRRKQPIRLGTSHEENADHFTATAEHDTDIPLKDIKKNKLTPVLELSGVSKFFGSLTAVENVSFNISENETLALLGANGAGKSTTFNMIRGLLKPSAGAISILDLNIVTNPEQARLYLGTCSQEDSIDDLTIRQTLNFYASIKGLRNVKHNVDKLLKAFKIMHFENVLVTKLSGGTRRKVMVCIALLGNPRLLLLDEPSTGLDAGAKRVLWEVIQSLSHDRATLLTTHSMEETEVLASKVAIVGRKLLAAGTVNQLKEKYGGSYYVRATYIPGAEVRVEHMIERAFGEKLPLERTGLGKIMQMMESMVLSDKFEDDENSRRRSGVEMVRDRHLTGGKLLLHYTISEPAMDDVFLNLRN
ncbi:hypothetical protein CJF30_00008578 [Rutstroemia sp. NJR-2017a BBW]|nr:hypothetical protein CJF30_00008578 [Rutstroemia sp. NJR-2017a BBW]